MSPPAKSVWRAFSTGPDSDVLIGPDFQPHYAQDRGQDLGVKTWPPGALGARRRHGVGLDLLRPRTESSSTTARRIPARGIPISARATTSGPPGVFARNPDYGRGEVVLPVQSARSAYDYDGVNENVLMELQIGGPHAQGARSSRSQRLSLRDRSRDGRSLIGQRVRPREHRTGDRSEDAAARNDGGGKEAGRGSGVVREICPHAGGGKDWQPSACSPVTKYLYIPHQNLCQDEEVVPANYIAGTPYVART